MRSEEGMKEMDEASIMRGEAREIKHEAWRMDDEG